MASVVAGFNSIVGQSMDIQEALEEIGKVRPCPHEHVDKSLGGGSVWARCEDCGETLLQKSLDRLRESHDRFSMALQVIEDSVKAQVGNLMVLKRLPWMCGNCGEESVQNLRSCGQHSVEAKCDNCGAEWVS